MATAPQPSINFHARIDLDTEERRRRLQADTGLSASGLVREAFRELEGARQSGTRAAATATTNTTATTAIRSCAARRAWSPPAEGLQRALVLNIIGAKAKTPEAATSSLKVLRVVLNHTVEIGTITNAAAWRYVARQSGEPISRDEAVSA